MKKTIPQTTAKELATKLALLYATADDGPEGINFARANGMIEALQIVGYTPEIIKQITERVNDLLPKAKV